MNIGQLFYPPLCIICRKSTRIKEQPFCLSCSLDLPVTDHFVNSKNAFVKHFWGRVPIQHGAALFDFRKENVVQEMIHALKYRRKKDVGTLLGSFAGRRIIESELFQNFDLIIPVPISSIRLHQRGYNQSGVFAESVGKQIKVDVRQNLLVKTTDTGSQTSRSRQERMLNVANTFKVRKMKSFDGKHILLVDDVITTGATLESCASLLLKNGAKSISCLTIAIAKSY